MKISLLPVFLRAALALSFAAHVLMLALLIGLMVVLRFGVVFKAELVVIAALVWYEHTLVKACDFGNIPVAFFNVNAVVSLSLLGFTVGDVLAKIVFY